MSLASPPEYPWRPEDKALKMIFASPGEPSTNSFDEFLNSDFYDLSDDETGGNFINNSGNMFSTLSCSAAERGSPTGAIRRVADRSSPQPWRKGLWCLKEHEPSKLVIKKTRKDESATQSYSPAALVSNGYISTTTNGRAETVYPDVNYHVLRANRLGNRSNFFNHNQWPSESKLSSNTNNNNTSFIRASNKIHDDWQEDFQNFSLGLTDSDSQHSSNPEGGDNASAFVAKRNIGAVGTGKKAAPTATRAVTTYPIFSSYTPLPAPPIPSQSSDMSSLHNPFLTEDKQWISTSLYSSDNPQQSQHNRSNRCYDAWQPGWVDARLSDDQLHLTPTAQDCFGGALKSAPQRSIDKAWQHREQAFVSNVETYSPSTEGNWEDFSCQADAWHNSSDHEFNTMPLRKSDYSNVLGSCPSIPPPSRDKVNDTSFITPKRRAKSQSRSPSPTASPTNNGSRSLRQKSPTRSEQSQHRRKSIHKPGPIKDGGGNTVRTRSASRPPRTPKTPKTPTTTFGQMDFVNFTPKDAAKILNDVAPSGSSKTRARREQEAREKRKKLSEAALQAVRRAGGDIAALKRAILHGDQDEAGF